MIKKPKESQYRKKIQQVTGLLLPVILVAGLFYPYLGLLVLLMMAGFLTLSLFKGRLWCGYACPRGSFLERYFSFVSLNRRIPSFLKTTAFKYAALVVMLVFFGINLASAWGSWEKTGAAFIRLCLQTSLVAFVIGFIYRPRTWCTFCPMGFLQGLLGRRRKPVKIAAFSCTDCKLCARVCPVEVQAHEHKNNGSIPAPLCLTCRNCVLNCPRQALSA